MRVFFNHKKIQLKKGNSLLYDIYKYNSTIEFPKYEFKEILRIRRPLVN